MNKSNRETIKVILYLVIFILIITTFFFMGKTAQYMYHNENAKINDILGKKWYGTANSYAYEYIKFDVDKNVSYIFYDKESDEKGMYDDCFNFIYSSNDNEFKIMCDNGTKKVKIKYYDDEKLTLNVNNENHVFYSSYEEASK